MHQEGRWTKYQVEENLCLRKLSLKSVSVTFFSLEVLPLLLPIDVNVRVLYNTAMEGSCSEPIRSRYAQVLNEQFCEKLNIIVLEYELGGSQGCTNHIAHPSRTKHLLLHAIPCPYTLKHPVCRLLWNSCRGDSAIPISNSHLWRVACHKLCANCVMRTGFPIVCHECFHTDLVDNKSQSKTICQITIVGDLVVKTVRKFEILSMEGKSSLKKPITLSFIESFQKSH